MQSAAAVPTRNVHEAIKDRGHAARPWNGTVSAPSRCPVTRFPNLEIRLHHRLAAKLTGRPRPKVQLHRPDVVVASAKVRCPPAGIPAYLLAGVLASMHAAFLRFRRPARARSISAPTRWPIGDAETARFCRDICLVRRTRLRHHEVCAELGATECHAVVGMGVQSVARSGNWRNWVCRLTLDRGSGESRAPNPSLCEITGQSPSRARAARCRRCRNRHR